MPQPPDQHGRAEHEQKVADDRTRDRRLDDVVEPLFQGQQRDDQLRGVPEGRVQETADGRAGISLVAVTLGVMALVVMLIIPIPPFLLDFLLAISITLSVLILMTALFIERPLQLSTFPTILLFTTLFRLGVNVASTRLILTDGKAGNCRPSKPP